MTEIRKERLSIAIILLTGIISIVEAITAGWELWAALLLLLGLVGIGCVHLTQKLPTHHRWAVYFIYSAIVVFYVCAHEDAMLDPALMISVLLVIFSLHNHSLFLHLALVEYVTILVYRFIISYMNGSTRYTTPQIMNLLAHLLTVLVIYLLCRISVSLRLSTMEEIDRWKSAADKDEHDVGDFLSNVSHELRTPVNVINGMTAIILKDENREELLSIRDACIRLTHQIEDIQDYTEVRRGELILTENEYMCDSLINDVVSYYKSSTRKKRLELLVDLAPDTPAVLRGDIEKIHKILRHLLENALKFTKKGGVYVRVYAETQEYGANLIIEMTDTGIGMTREQLDKLSTGMYQANKKRNRSTGGIGLGFTIIYGFVRKMGGFVTVTSEKGAGTTVHLSIPQQVVDPRPCLSIEPGKAGDVVYYIRPGRIQVPEIREYNNALTARLAAGLDLHMYAAANMKDFRKLLNELKVTHVFTGIDEYNTDKEVFDALVGEGCQVVVTTQADRSSMSENGVLFISKPLYGSTIVRIINGDYMDLHRGDLNAAKPSYAGIHALVVDDEPMNLVVAMGIFKKYGFVVETAESGKEAIQKYRDGDYTVVFMDHMMPEMDGVEAMKQIRHVAAEHHQNPVILALTANVLSGAREMFMQEGFDGFLAKPIDINEFERVMKRVLSEVVNHDEGRAE